MHGWDCLCLANGIWEFGPCSPWNGCWRRSIRMWWKYTPDIRSWVSKSCCPLFPRWDFTKSNENISVFSYELYNDLWRTHLHKYDSFVGLRSRNLSAIRHAAQVSKYSLNIDTLDTRRSVMTRGWYFCSNVFYSVFQRGLNQLQNQTASGPIDPLDHTRSRLPPLIIQGLRTHESDSESHVLFFDIEALIVQLLSDEYGALSPSTLESQGLISQSEFCKILTLTHSASPDAQKKIADFFGKVKDKAGDMERILKDKDRHGDFLRIPVFRWVPFVIEFILTGLLAKVKEGAEKIQAKAESALLIKQEREASSRKSAFTPFWSPGKNLTNNLFLFDKVPVRAWAWSMEWPQLGRIGACCLSQQYQWKLHNFFCHCSLDGGWMLSWIKSQNLVLAYSSHLCPSHLDNSQNPVKAKRTPIFKVTFLTPILTVRLDTQVTCRWCRLPGSYQLLATPWALISWKPKSYPTVWSRSPQNCTGRFLIPWQRTTYWRLWRWQIRSCQCKTQHLFQSKNVCDVQIGQFTTSTSKLYSTFVFNYSPSTRQSQSSTSSSEDSYISQQAGAKHGWSLVATLHCVMLHDKIATLHSKNFKEPLVEVRWTNLSHKICFSPMLT